MYAWAAMVGERHVAAAYEYESAQRHIHMEINMYMCARSTSACCTHVECGVWSVEWSV